LEEIENDFLKGNNDYPETPTEAYNLLVNYRTYTNTNKRTQPYLDQVAFLMRSEGEHEDGERQNHSHIKCFKCGTYGHYKSDCPKKTAGRQQEQSIPQRVTVTTLMTRAKILSMMEEQHIDPMWLLCDNESTVDIIKNKDMLTNLRRAKKQIEVSGIGGEPQRITIEGDLLGYGTVYYHPDVAANILSFFNMTKRFKSVTYDNEKEDAFLVQRDDKSIMKFRPSTEGLYYYDFKESILRKELLESRSVEEKKEGEHVMAVKTVEEIKRNFTKREVEAAEQARRLYVIMGRPSGQTFERVIRQGLVLNNPVTIHDYRNALQIYGEDLGVLKGKTVRTKPEHVKIEIESMTPCKQIGIILSADIMYFTGLAFLITVSRSIGFITVTLLADRKKQTMLDAMKQIMNLYRNRGHEIKELDFNVQGQPIHMILVDNEFQVLKEEIETLGVNINVVSKDEHVPEVERQN
jgi:hypothetical protein